MKKCGGYGKLLAFAIAIYLGHFNSCPSRAESAQNPEFFSKSIEIVDLDNDGRKDRVTIVNVNNEKNVVLLENGTNSDASTQFVLLGAFATLVNQTSIPTFEKTGSTTFSIHAGCDTCGSQGVIEEYKVAYRDGEYVLSGYKYTAWNRNAALIKSCDVNLLAGVAEIIVQTKTDDDSQPEKVQSDDKRFSVFLLRPDYRPKICSSIEP